MVRADGGIGSESGTQDIHPAVDGQPLANRTVDHQKRGATAGAGRTPVEVVAIILHGFQGGQDNGKVFRDDSLP